MQITFKLFASLSDHLPESARRTNALSIEVAEDCSFRDIIEQWALPPRMVHLVLVNGEFIPPEQRAMHRLREGDALAIWPPIAGG